MTRFLESYVSFVLLALSLTPELTSAMSILVAAVFVGLVNMYVARTSRLVALKEVARAIAPVQDKVDSMLPVLSRVDAHVNSEKTRAQGEAIAKDQQIALQREMIEEMKKAAQLLAQAKATADVAATLAPTSAGVAPSTAAVVTEAIAESPHLQEIETNTKDTVDELKKNTKK